MKVVHNIQLDLLLVSGAKVSCGTEVKNIIQRYMPGEDEQADLKYSRQFNLSDMFISLRASGNHNERLSQVRICASFSDSD